MEHEHHRLFSGQKLGRDRQGPLPTVWLRNVPSPGWQGTVCSPLDPGVQIPDALSVVR
jgi:hypothetical protein